MFQLKEFRLKIYIIFQIIIIFNCIASSRCGDNPINNTKNTFLKNSNQSKKNNLFHQQKRKLDEEDKNEEVFSEIKIFYDLYNYNKTFPNETLGENSKELILEAVYKAEKIITDLFKMKINSNSFAFYNNNLEEWVTYWDPTLEGLYSTDNYNFFIFFRFSSTIRGDASSEIVLDYDNPSAGLITINKYLNSSKLEINYLTHLMLHHFIHLLGFHISNDEYSYSIIKEKEEEEITHYYVDETKIISYAQNYFNCNRIDKIELELNEDGDIHWPSRLLLGDIMTEFFYPEEQVISGFTMAFMGSLEFIFIKKNIQVV